MSIGIGISLGFKSGGAGFNFNGSPSELTATTYSNTRIDLSCTSNSGGIEDGFSWERSEDLGINYIEIDTTPTGDNTYSDITFTKPAIIYYRCRAFKGNIYSIYSNIAIIYPAGIRVNSANTSVLLADPANQFYFNIAGQDQPFSVLAIIKSNDLTITNILLSRGDTNGLSYYCGLHSLDKAIDFSIYNGNIATNNLIYKKTSLNLQDSNNNRIAWTYSGNELPTGMKIYKNGVQPSYSDNTKYGTYIAMFNGTGMYVGHEMAPGNPENIGKFDLSLLLICNKELSQTEVTEFQNMIEESDIAALSFYANIISINKFAGTLVDELGIHNGTSVAPTFFLSNHMTDSSLENTTTFLPDTEKTIFQDSFEHFKLGWFICYGMETYNDEFAMNYPPPTPAIFNIASVNIATWAALAASYGKIDYAILTVSHGYGFSLYNHQTAIWRGTNRTTVHGSLPVYNKYDTGETISAKNIVSDFITEFDVVNIKPILYYEIGISINWTGNDYIINHYTDENFQFVYYHNYIRERLQELARLNPYAIWIDVIPWYPLNYVKDLYYAIKKINSAIGVIYNCYNNKDRIDNTYFPFDGAATEENAKPTLPSDDWWVLNQNYGGITYPCTKELIITSFEENRWFYNAANHVLRPIAELQAEYDYAKAAGVPSCISVCPKEDGIIYQNQADLVGSIIL